MPALDFFRRRTADHSLALPDWDFKIFWKFLKIFEKFENFENFKILWFSNFQNFVIIGNDEFFEMWILKTGNADVRGYRNHKTDWFLRRKFFSHSNFSRSENHFLAFWLFWLCISPECFYVGLSIIHGSVVWDCKILHSWGISFHRSCLHSASLRSSTRDYKKSLTHEGFYNPTLLTRVWLP